MRSVNIAAATLAAMAMSGASAMGGAVQEAYVVTRSAAAPFAPHGSGGGRCASGNIGGRHISPAGRKPAGLIRRQVAARRSRDS